MSIGEQAVILIRLDARRGQCVPINDLAAHMGIGRAGMNPTTVARHVVDLETAGYVLAQRDAAGTVIGAALTASAIAMLTRGEARRDKLVMGATA